MTTTKAAKKTTKAAKKTTKAVKKTTKAVKKTTKAVKKTTNGWLSRETPPLYDPRPGALGTPVLVWPYKDRCDLKPRVMMAYYGVRVTDTPEFYLYGAVLGDITQWQPVPEGPEEVSPMASKSKWKKGLKLSEYLLLAVENVRAAISIGHYTLDGNYWHTPRPYTCYICLAGGILARLSRFKHREIHAPWIDHFRWEEEVLLALGEVSSGHLLVALRYLHGDSYHLPQEAQRIVKNCSARIRRHVKPSMSAIAPLEVYEAVALQLKAVGL
jgi:hypothetical protein